jgi:hypothetical protein
MNTYGVTGPAILRRACQDRITAELTLTLTPPADACGSFTYHRLYGREDASSSWRLLKQVNTLNINTINTTLSSKKKWEVYIVTSFACNGKDSFSSNHLFIDDIAPKQFEPDSVSIDFSTQRVIAGWARPNEPDILGYSLFKFQGGGNALLVDTFSTQYIFNKSQFDPTIANNQFALAAFDSCLNGGLISNYHSPIKLDVQVDAKFWCSKKTILSWRIYQGWLVSKYDVFRFDVTTNTWAFLGSKITDLTNNPGTYQFKDSTYILNHGYLYFVRAHRVGSSTTSTSNTVSIAYAHSTLAPPLSVLHGVSVLSDNQLVIDGQWQKDGTSSSLQIQKRVGASWQTIQASTTTGAFNLSDNSVSAANTKYIYRTLRKNDCGYIDDSCCLHQNMLLAPSLPRALKWNSYFGWSCPFTKSIFDYTIEIKDGSTWKQQQVTTDTFYAIPNNLYGKQLFRISIFSKNGVFSPSYILYSNEITLDLGIDTSRFDTLLIPSAITSKGEIRENKIFKISNPAISPGQSTLTIINRWGEIIAKVDALVGWDGIDPSGNHYPGGVYVYLFNASYNNKRISKSGTFLIID